MIEISWHLVENRYEVFCVYIERLKSEDIEQVLRIYNYYILNSCFTLEEEALSLETFTKRCETIMSRYPYIVAKDDDGKVVGYAYLDEFNSRSAYRHTADLSIYVDKDRLHDHIGQFLLDNIEDIASEYEITTIISLVTSENNNSVKFHERNGFLLEGNIRDCANKFGKDLGVYYYRKALKGLK